MLFDSANSKPLLNTVSYLLCHGGFHSDGHSVVPIFALQPYGGREQREKGNEETRILVFRTHTKMSYGHGNGQIFPIYKPQRAVAAEVCR